MDQDIVQAFTKGVMDRIRDHLGIFPFDPMPVPLEMWSVSNDEDKFRGYMFLERDIFLRKMRYTIERGRVEQYGLMNGVRPGMDLVGYVTGIHAVNWIREKHHELYRNLIDLYHFQYDVQRLDSSYVIDAEGTVVGLFDEQGELDTVLQIGGDGGERHAA